MCVFKCVFLFETLLRKLQEHLKQDFIYQGYSSKINNLKNTYPMFYSKEHFNFTV